MTPSKIGFIVGMGRSGTTLIAAILNRHPEICVLPETGFFVHLNSLSNEGQDLETGWPDTMMALADKMRPNATLTWNPMETARTLIENYPIFPGIETLFQAFCREIAEKCGKPNARLILEKTPDHMLCAPEIRRHFPSAPIVHVIRDGRAVAESRSRMQFLPSQRRDLELNILDWAWRMREIRPHLLQQGPTFELRYEALVQNPEAIIQETLDFLELEYRPGLHQPSGNENQLIETGMTHKDGIKRPIDPKLAESWRKRIHPERQKMLERLAGEQLHELGYPLHHIQIERTNPAQIPHTLITRPGLLKQYKNALRRLLEDTDSTVSRTFTTIETASSHHNICVMELIDPAKAREIGTLKHCFKLVALAFRLRVRGKGLYLLRSQPQYTFREWPLAWMTESLVRMIASAP